MKPKIFIGPMSKNIVDSVIKYSEKYDTKIGLIASRRQVDFDGGYVNNWNTEDFCEYVKSKTKNVLLVRDHAGPEQGKNSDDGYMSLIHDSDSFDVIHIDVWKKYQNLEEGLIETKKMIEFINKINPEVLFEIGTEQSIREFNTEELEHMLSFLKENLRKDIYQKIKYLVIQSGTSLKEGKNTGVFDEDRLIKMIEVCKSHNLISKVHNGDFLETDLIKRKFELGIDSINIAPEFGRIETDIVLKHYNYDEKFVNEFFDICYESKKWEKWVDESFDPFENKIELIRICGHYVFSEPRFISITNNYNFFNLVFDEVESKLNTLTKKNMKMMIQLTFNNGLGNLYCGMIEIMHFLEHYKNQGYYIELVFSSNGSGAQNKFIGNCTIEEIFEEEDLNFFDKITNRQSSITSKEYENYKYHSTQYGPNEPGVHWWDVFFEIMPDEIPPKNPYNMETLLNGKHVPKFKPRLNKRVYEKVENFVKEKGKIDKILQVRYFDLRPTPEEDFQNFCFKVKDKINEEENNKFYISTHNQFLRDTVGNLPNVILYDFDKISELPNDHGYYYYHKNFDREFLLDRLYDNLAEMVLISQLDYLYYFTSYNWISTFIYYAKSQKPELNLIRINQNNLDII